MTVRITLHLPDELVDFIDEQVAAGAAPNRSAYVTEVLERERRRLGEGDRSGESGQPD